MGLHRESTYSKLENPGSARRIMWSLYAADTLQSACFGRPSGIASSEFDIRLVQLADFELSNIQAELFIEYTKLNIILGRMVDCHNRRSEHSPEDVRINIRNKKTMNNRYKNGSAIYHTA
ncbi:hypothetical protein N7467_004340 [Penicillium canescens]|nr:hypothetical protein N7467_004340 [Penicillium canescens]